MIDMFVPKMYKKDVFSIDYDKLKKSNIKLLVFDLDNTISLVDGKVPSSKIKALINKLSNDFIVFIASNNNYQRVFKFCKSLNCDYLASSLKPTFKLTRYLKKKYNFLSHQVAMVGDQMVTDIFLSNRSGFLSILVDPMGDKDLKITTLNRFVENIVKKKISFKKGDYYEKN